MADYKLYYFPFKARGEPIRLLFAYKGIKYEDIRIPFDKWLENKPNTPFGMLPVLEENGKKLGGGLVILRYLAEKPEFGCAGSNAWENAWLANIADFINDFSEQLTNIHFEKDEQKKKELQEKVKQEAIPNYLGKLNEMAADTGHLFSDKLTWPELKLYWVLEVLTSHNSDLLTNFPGLAKLKSNIESDPNIAKWLAERPQTPY